MQDTEYYSMMRNQYHNNDWEAKLKEKKAQKAKSFIELAESRYSVRKFKETPLSEDHLSAILHAAHIAPTGCNNQAFRIYVFKNPEALEKMRQCTRCHFGAPTGMLICWNRDESWYRPYDREPCGPEDACIVTTHMMLQAWELGIGSCWVMHFKSEEFRKQFDIPDSLIPVAFLPLGYPAEDAAPAELHSKVRPLEELVITL